PPRRGRLLLLQLGGGGPRDGALSRGRSRPRGRLVVGCALWKIRSVRIEILGPFVLRDEQGRALLTPGGRPAALLPRLALAPGRTVGADLLLEEVWDGDPPGGGAQTLGRL